MAAPKISISCPTTWTATIFEDIENYAAAGASGIGLWEFKFAGHDDGEIRDAMQAAGLAATLCCPTVPSLIPDPFFSEPADPDERLAALTAAIHRLSRFSPAAILVTTGQPGDYGLAEARRIVTEKLKPAADAAGELGIVLGVEPYRRTSGTLVTSLPETLDLVDAVGRSNVKVIIDAWHYWDVPDGLRDLRENADCVVGVQLNDWREPTRSWCDRVLPGDGSIDLRSLLRSLDSAGFEGWYDVEVFSDNGLFGSDYPDSVWARPPAEVARDSVSKVMDLWRTRNKAA